MDIGGFGEDQSKRITAASKSAHISGWQSADVLVSEGGNRGPAIHALRAYHAPGLRVFGLGPDFVNGPGRNDPGTVDRSRMPAEVYSDKPWLYVKGFEDITELPNVTRGLIQRGWSTGELHKVLGENWLRVYETVWGS